MSYILDALRRSQAERDRGQVPGLDAQPGAGAPPAPAPRRLAWPWLLLGGLVTVAALAAGLVLSRSSPAVPAAPPPAAAHRDLGAAAPAPPPAAAVPAAAAPASSPVATVGAALAPVQLPMVVSAPAPLLPPATLPTPPPSALPTAGLAVPSGAAAAASAAIPLAQLTPAQKRELPALAISGSIWSENAANRFVMVNGQVVREGEAAAPGVVVERIGPKTLWLRWRALRIEMPL